MEKLKDFLIVTIGKLEKIDYALVILLWVIGTILAINGMPWINIGILIMHACEFPIGWKVGRNAGYKVPELLVMHFTFGFTWWVPVLYKQRLEK